MAISLFLVFVALLPFVGYFLYIFLKLVKEENKLSDSISDGYQEIINGYKELNAQLEEWRDEFQNSGMSNVQILHNWSAKECEEGYENEEKSEKWENSCWSSSEMYEFMDSGSILDTWTHIETPDYIMDPQYAALDCNIYHSTYETH